MVENEAISSDFLGDRNPFPLKQNGGKSFQGSIVLGKGFVLTPQEAESLIAKDSRNRDVLFPYLNGDDLNNDPEQKPSRWVINFFDWPLGRYSEDQWSKMDKEIRGKISRNSREGKFEIWVPPFFDKPVASDYPDCLAIIEKLVKPERMKQNDKGGKEKWWQFLRPRTELYETISKLDQVMVMNRYTKHLALDFQSKETVFSDSIIVFALDSYCDFAFMTSALHEVWAWKNSSTMGASTLRYSPTNAFDTFVFPPKLTKEIEEVGVSLVKLRKSVMLEAGIGLTELYNLFHDENFKVTSKEIHAQIITLRQLHRDLDVSVLNAYGWSDLNLGHNFYQVEYLPENDRTRFTISTEARKEILKRLLILNREIYKNEVSINLTLKKKGKEPEKSKETGLFQNPIELF